MVNKRTVISRLLDLLTPRACLLCEDQTNISEVLCPACLNSLVRITNACARCGNSLADAILCGNCIRTPPFFDSTVSVYAYRYPVTDLIRALKYKQKLIVARELGLKLAQKIRLKTRVLPDCIIPVPLHRRRFLGRGFNQAHEISRVLASQLQLPIDNNLIRRVRPTRPQFELSAKQRYENVTGAFELLRSPDYKTVAIVDDIVTTGATVNEVAKLLKRACVLTVEVWACALAR